MSYPITSRELPTPVDSTPTGGGTTIPLHPYQLPVPADLPPLHKKLKLGHPGLNPQHPDQVEDQLTADKLRTGFFEKYLFKNEIAQGAEMMYEHLTDRSKLLNLGNFLCRAILKQRDEAEVPSLCEASSPTVDKMSLTEEARTNWLSTVTLPHLALSRIPHTVPHGLRIEKLIWQLEAQRCPLSQAVWLIRLVVLSDQKLKKVSPTQVTQDWTSQFIKVLERTMVELMKSGTGEGEGENNNNHSFDRSLGQWEYCTRLSQSLYAQDLLDKKSFLRWVVDIVGTSTVKCIYMIPIIMTFLPDLFQSRILFLMMLRSIIPHYEQTLNPVEDPTTVTAFPSFCRGIIELAMLQAPDVLVAPYLSYPSIITNWDRHLATPDYPHRNIIHRVLGIHPTTPDQITTAARTIMARNKRFTDCPLFQPDSLPSTRELVNPFEDFGPVTLATDLTDLVRHIFKDTKPSHSDRIYTIISQLLTWVIRHGAKDPELKYLVSAVIKIWANAKTESPSPSQSTDSIPSTLNGSPRKEVIEGALLKFLDQGIDQATAHPDLLDLYSQLTRQGTFLYLRYLRRAIARGYLNLHLNFTPTAAYRHLAYLSCLPAYAADQAISHHRKTSLQPPGFTPVCDFDHEQRLLDSIMYQLTEKLPAILGPPSPSLASQIVPTIDDPVVHGPLISPWDGEFLVMLQATSRYIRGEVITYLMQGVINYVIKDVKIGEDNWRVISKPGTALINVREFTLIATLFEVCQEFGALLELCLWILVHTEERTLIPTLVNVFRRYQSYLIANGFASAVTAGLWKKHREFKTTVNHLDKTTMLYLLHLATMQAPGATSAMRSEIEACFQSLVPTRPHNGSNSGGGSTDIAEYVAELYDPPSDSNTLRSRSASLCMRYRHVPGWWGKLFTNSTQLIHHRVTSGGEPNGAKLIQMVRNYSDLFRFLGDFSLEPSSALQEWIRPILFSTTLSSGSPAGTEMAQWFMVYLSFLVSRSLCPLNTILKMVLSSIELAVHSYQQQRRPTPCEQLLQNGHLFLLVRLLLTHDSLHKNVFGNVELGAQDIFLLEQMRYTVFHSVESLEIPFRLLYQFSLLESLLPAQHPLAEPLHLLCRHLASMPWFIKFGKRHTTDLYSRYMADGGAPLRALPLLTSRTHQLDPIPLPDEIHQPLSMKLMDWFLIVLGEETESTSVYFTSAFRPSLPQPPLPDPINVEIFAKDLVLINLYLERLVYSESRSQNPEEITSYIKNFFHGWVANPQLPERVLILAFEGIPSTLWPEFLSYGETLLSGEPDTLVREFPNYIPHLQSQLMPVKEDGSRRSPSEGHIIMNRFQIVIQTLLICNKDTGSDESLGQAWNTAKFQFGSHLLNELTSFAAAQESFSIMMHAHCGYSQSLNYLGNPGGIYEASIQAANSDSADPAGITIEMIIEAIVMRLELLIPLISSLVNRADSTTLKDWIEATFNIMTSPLALTTPALFDLTLDFFSYFMGELPKDAKGEVFALLRNIQLRLPAALLADPRVLRLFPFEARSSFPSDLRTGPSKASPTHPPSEDVPRGIKVESPAHPPPPTPPVFNPWEWDKSLVRDKVPLPLSQFSPRAISSLTHLTPPTITSSSDPTPLLEAHQLIPPASLPTTPKTTPTTPHLPRLSSTTVHSRSKFATTARSAASPLMSFRSTLSPLAALQHSLHLLSQTPPPPPKKSSPLNDPKP